MRPLPAAGLILTWFLGVVAVALFLIHRSRETMDATTYPTGPELRRAAAAAVLRRNDDPLLPEVLKAAARAAAEGAYECNLELVAADGSELPELRRDGIERALDAIQIRARWQHGHGQGCRRLQLSWR